LQHWGETHSNPSYGRWKRDTPTPYANKRWGSEETDEAGLDDMDLGCFVGRPNPPPFLMSVGPGNYWTSIKGGDKWLKKKNRRYVSIN